MVTNNPKRPRQRPPLFDETMKQTAVRLSSKQREWLRKNGGSAKVRELIDAAMAHEALDQRKEGGDE